jgi:hypothetical protein
MGDQVRRLAEAYVFLKWTDGRHEHFTLDSIDREPYLFEYTVTRYVEEDEPDGNSARERLSKRQKVSLQLSGRGDVP